MPTRGQYAKVSNFIRINTLIHHLLKRNCLLCMPMLRILCDHRVPSDKIPSLHTFKYEQGIVKCPTLGIHGNESIFNVAVIMKTHVNYLTMSTLSMSKCSTSHSSTKKARVRKTIRF
ncbi:hypothetical protein AAHE18_20G182200 [Arachis hypogaea]